MYLCGKAIHVSDLKAKLSNKFWARHLVDNVASVVEVQQRRMKENSVQLISVQLTVELH
jgi:hypothetical protein